MEAVRREIAKELPGQDISISVENGAVFLRGTVKNLNSAERAAAIAATFGKIVNLLQVEVPPVDAQVLLKVRFANVDRAASTDLGVNLFSTGAAGNIGSTTTGQFSPPTPTTVTSNGGAGSATFKLSDALNIFLFRPDLNLGATITRAAKQADAGNPRGTERAGHRRKTGQLPGRRRVSVPDRSRRPRRRGDHSVPGVRGELTFLPNITPRGTIRLQVTPEVSSLDFANGLMFQGFNIPAFPRGACRRRSNWKAARALPSAACWITGSPRPGARFRVWATFPF